MVRNRIHPSTLFNWRTTVLTIALISAAALFIRIDAAPSAHAATFTVNASDDATDGVCDATHCSLREAIAAANAAAGKDLITFNVASGATSISVTVALPEITGAVTLDGSTQPGYVGVPLVELDGTGAGAAVDGLVLSAGNSEIRALIINGFSRHGLRIRSGGGNTIERLFIGTDATGASAVPNGANGIWIDASANNTIGGSSPAVRNIISGNGAYGVEITGGSNGALNRVRANYIGTDAAGSAAIPNSTGGVRIAGDNNSVGDTSPGRRNVISGNGESGVLLAGAATTQNVIAGNYVGVAADGASPLPNANHGVLLDNAIGHNTIGGTGGGAGNVIAHNTRNGVFVASGTGHPLLGNSIHSNGGLGIDLFDQAGTWGVVTPNDTGDGDAGANMRQNFPTLVSALPSGASIAIAGTLNTSASQTFRLEFFASPTCDASNGEGASYLGFTNVTTDASGNASFNVALGATVAEGNWITATTRDSSQNTSEFSPCRYAGIEPTATPTATPTDTPTPTSTPTDTATPAPTDTPVPTSTNTTVPTSTNTSVPTSTDTSVPTSTNTSVPTSTNTAVPTSTNTAVPTSTNTSVPTSTDTSVPTSTNTSVPTSTNTSVPTSTNTSVPTPTNTPQPTSTHTALPATNTPPAHTATPALTKTPPRGICGAADINGDGKINGRDVAAMVHALLKGKKDRRFDVNGDGRVNGRDLKLVLKCVDRVPSRTSTPTPKPAETPKPEKTAKPTKTPKATEPHKATKTPTPGAD